ncbi:AvrD family protein [Enterococcus sp. RIT-PI-f]|uniref:AvrD family protein n=1 Tax=Enterococcus sp. RIT-PI-f TaxID=1690244 RepID=UPI0006B9A7F3|nr:AvrD family protein [Enterococcus sp. RIT-PI-f]KPG69752.1 hypothetical protein AEQ18_10000 [Enterococcus sp. RIT-PI-f]
MVGIDQILGKAKNRYFGYGHKGTVYQIIRCEITEKPPNFHIIGRIQQESIWSEKSGVNLTPHLSTVDGLIFAMLAAEIYLEKNNSTVPVETLLLTSFEIKSATTPIENIDQIVISIKNSLIDRVNKCYAFLINIQGMKINISLKEKIPVDSASKKNSDKNCYVSNHLKQSFHDILDIQLNEKLEIFGRINRTPINNLNFSGIQSQHEGALSLIEWLIVFSQLSQVAAYRFDMVDRNETNNLWMRTVKAEIVDPYLPESDPLTVQGKIDEVKLITMQAEEWRTFKMSGHTNCHNIRFMGKVAHKLPYKARQTITEGKTYG